MIKVPMEPVSKRTMPMKAAPRRGIVPALLALLVVSQAMGGQATAGTPADAERKAVAYAEVVIRKALDFAQGDLASLRDAQVEFSPQAWAEFMKYMDGFLDAGGAPTFASRFVPSGPALDVRTVDGIVQLTIPGVLTQESRSPMSVTAYRAEIDVQVSGSLLRIVRVTQRTCGGAKTHATCR